MTAPIYTLAKTLHSPAEAQYAIYEPNGTPIGQARWPWHAGIGPIPPIELTLANNAIFIDTNIYSPTEILSKYVKMMALESVPTNGAALAKNGYVVGEVSYIDVPHAIVAKRGERIADHVIEYEGKTYYSYEVGFGKNGHWLCVYEQPTDTLIAQIEIPVKIKDYCPVYRIHTAPENLEPAIIALFHHHMWTPIERGPANTSVKHYTATNYVKTPKGWNWRAARYSQTF